MLFKTGGFELQGVRRDGIRIETKVDEVVGRTDRNDRARRRCTWIRYGRRDKTVAEFAKIFRKNAQTRG